MSDSEQLPPGGQAALDAIVAATDVILRSGGTTEWHFDPTFTGSAIHGGHRFIVDEYPHDPEGGADELAIRVLHGGGCNGCQRTIAAQDKRPLRTDVPLTGAQLCWWERKGTRWERQCGDPAPEGSSREKLAQALIAERYVHPAMIAAARGGRYDIYHPACETPFPVLLLLEDLKQYGEQAAGLRERVQDDEFDSTPEEMDAWAASPDGQETFAELVNGGRPAPAPPPPPPTEEELRRRADAARKRRQVEKALKKRKR